MLKSWFDCLLFHDHDNFAVQTVDPQPQTAAVEEEGTSKGDEVQAGGDPTASNVPSTSEDMAETVNSAKDSHPIQPDTWAIPFHRALSTLPDMQSLLDEESGISDLLQKVDRCGQNSTSATITSQISNVKCLL